MTLWDSAEYQHIRRIGAELKRRPLAAQNSSSVIILLAFRMPSIAAQPGLLGKPNQRRQSKAAPRADPIRPHRTELKISPHLILEVHDPDCRDIVQIHVHACAGNQRQEISSPVLKRHIDATVTCQELYVDTFTA